MVLLASSQCGKCGIQSTLSVMIPGSVIYRLVILQKLPPLEALCRDQRRIWGQLSSPEALCEDKWRPVENTVFITLWSFVRGQVENEGEILTAGSPVQFDLRVAPAGANVNTARGEYRQCWALARYRFSRRKSSYAWFVPVSDMQRHDRIVALFELVAGLQDHDMIDAWKELIGSL